MKSLDERIAQVFAAVFGVDTIDDSTSIMTLEEWDSVVHITLVLELEKEFGVTISTDEAVEMLSVPDIRRLLTNKGIAAR